MKEIKEMMDSRRVIDGKSIRFGDLVLSTLVKDTERIMDQWTLYMGPVSPATLAVDDIFSNLKG